MKKTRLGLAIVICLGIFASSCSQYRFIPFFPPEDDTTPYDVGSSEDLESMLETTGNARLTSDIDITSDGKHIAYIVSNNKTGLNKSFLYIINEQVQ